MSNNIKIVYRKEECISKLKEYKAKSEKFLNAYETMNVVQRAFIDMVMNDPERKKDIKNAKGYRYTWDQKVIALSIYKRSPSCYSYLQNIVHLPSETCLQRLQREIPVGTGITETAK